MPSSTNSLSSHKPLTVAYVKLAPFSSVVLHFVSVESAQDNYPHTNLAPFSIMSVEASLPF